jgi:hypothetical protein
MSKADEVFGPIPGPLVQEWGSTCQFIRVTDPGTYDPATGVVASNETIYNVKAVFLELEPQEYEGVFQQSDFKLIIDPGQIGGGYISTSDRFVVPFPSGEVNCKVIDVVTYRGDAPISFEVIVRPQ